MFKRKFHWYSFEVVYVSPVGIEIVTAEVVVPLVKKARIIDRRFMAKIFGEPVIKRFMSEQKSAMCNGELKYRHISYLGHFSKIQDKRMS